MVYFILYSICKSFPISYHDVKIVMINIQKFVGYVNWWCQRSWNFWKLERIMHKFRWNWLACLILKFQSH